MNAFRDGFKRLGIAASSEAYADIAKHMHILGEDAFDKLVAQVKRDRGGSRELDGSSKAAEIICFQRSHALPKVHAKRQPTNRGDANRAAASAKATSALEDMIWHTTRLCGRTLASYNMHELQRVVKDKDNIIAVSLRERRLAELLIGHARPNEVTSVRDAVPTAKLREFIAEAEAYSERFIGGMNG